ncbi:hypothetical protein ThrDRAFT_00297 [Frankia casuarinae]|nr:hypothetical protein ThrDRAFT_00297 [Frankia casuarinae]
MVRWHELAGRIVASATLAGGTDPNSHCSSHQRRAPDPRRVGNSAPPGSRLPPFHRPVAGSSMVRWATSDGGGLARLRTPYHTPSSRPSGVARYDSGPIDSESALGDLLPGTSNWLHIDDWVLRTIYNRIASGGRTRRRHLADSMPVHGVRVMVGLLRRQHPPVSPIRSPQDHRPRRRQSRRDLPPAADVSTRPRRAPDRRKAHHPNADPSSTRDHPTAPDKQERKRHLPRPNRRTTIYERLKSEMRHMNREGGWIRRGDAPDRSRSGAYSRQWSRTEARSGAGDR